MAFEQKKGYGYILPSIVLLLMLMYVREFLPTCFQAAPVEFLEEWLTLELSTLVVLEAQPFCWVFLHQPFAESFAIRTEGGRVGYRVVEDPSRDFFAFNLK